MIDICISEKKENKFYSIDLHDKMPLILSLCTCEWIFGTWNGLNKLKNY